MLIERDQNYTDPGIESSTIIRDNLDFAPKCIKCLTNHANIWACEYNFSYYNWTLHELERVKRTLNIK